MNSSYSLIFLIIILVLLFIYYFNKTQKHQESKSKSKSNTQRNDFDTTSLEIVDYIDNKINNFTELIKENELKCAIDKNDPMCKFKIFEKNLANNMGNFSKKLNTYIDVVNEDINETVNNIKENISVIDKQDEKLYNKYVQKFYDILDNKKIIDNKDNIIKSHFTNTLLDKTEYYGEYLILPYQYILFNNIKMFINKENFEEDEKEYEKNVLYFKFNDIMLNKFEIDINLNQKSLICNNKENNEIDECNLDYNRLTIKILNEIELKQNELDFKYYKDNYTRKMLVDKIENFGFKKNNIFNLLLSDFNINKIYYNKDINKFFGENEEKYYLDKNDKLFRLYDEHEGLIFNLKKKSD